MKGVIATRAPGVPVVDVSHGVPPQDVTAGALVLRAAAPWFPPGTVHVAVVDPGVGGVRRAVCVETDRARFVGPDNGVLSLAAPAASVHRAVVLADERFLLSPRSRTFHGRDVFAPVAAALATGTDVAALGPPAGDVARLALPEPTVASGRVDGQVVHVDRFGNLVTNVPGRLVASGRWRASVAGTFAGPLVDAYAGVAPGEALAVVDSWDVVEIAVRDGSARERFGAGPGAAVVLEVA